MLRRHKKSKRSGSDATRSTVSSIGNRTIRRVNTRLPQLLQRFYTALGIKRQDPRDGKRVLWRVHVRKEGEEDQQ